MAGFQQVISGGATDRSGSASQPDRMRAASEARAGSMIADSIVMGAEATAGFMEQANEVVRTGATQYAQKEYLGGETDLGAGEIDNLQRIQQAHQSGRITADQANLLKRKLGAQVVKHNPLADPSQISSDIFGQGAFKQTAAEKDAIAMAKEQRKQVDSMLEKYNMLNPYDSPEEKQRKMESALRMESAKAETNAMSAEFESTGRMVMPNGSLVDARNFSANYYDDVEKQMLRVVSQGGDPDSVNIALDSIVNKAKLNYQNTTRELAKTENGQPLISSQLEMLTALRNQFSDELLTGKLNKDKASNIAQTAKSRLDLQKVETELQFRANNPGAEDALLVMNKIGEAVKGNPFLQMQVQQEMGNLSSKVVKSITAGDTGYNDVPGLSWEKDSNTILSTLSTDVTKSEPLEIKGVNSAISNAIKGLNEEAKSGANSETSPEAWLRTFDGIATGRFGKDEGVKESASVLMTEGARVDFIPNTMTFLKQDLRAKGLNPEDVLKPENFEVKPNGQLALVGVSDSVKAIASTSPYFRNLNKYTTAFKALDVEPELIRHSLVTNPAFGVQADTPIAQSVGAGARKVADTIDAGLVEPTADVLNMDVADYYMKYIGQPFAEGVQNAGKTLKEVLDEFQKGYEGN